MIWSFNNLICSILMGILTWDKVKSYVIVILDCSVTRSWLTDVGIASYW